MTTQLAIVERAYRGAVEKQFFDCLTGLRLHRRLGPLDVQLRGVAVLYASAAARTPAVRLGPATVDTLTEPAADLRTLMADDVGIWVEAADAGCFGLTGPGALLPGVAVATAAELAVRWARYDLVYYF